MTTSFNTATASLAQMVAYFNTISPTPVKKFSDRKSAIARIEAAEAKLPQVVAPVPELACPACGATQDITQGTYSDRTMEVTNEHEATCHGCGHEFNVNTMKALRKGKKGHVHTNTAKVKGVWLKPEICATPAQVEAAAHDGVRRRPVTATTELGAVVVCSARTARKHGWVITGKLYGTTKATPAPAPAKASKAPAKPAKATTKATVKRAARLETLEDLLG